MSSAAAGTRQHPAYRRARAQGLRAALGRGAAQPAALLHGLERLRNADLRPALSMVRVPTLVIAGAHDRIVRPGASRALAALADARYVEFAGAAHAPFLSHPKRFAQLWAASCVAESPELFRLDRTAVRSAFDRASARYESAASLQARVERELLSRLESFQFTPQVVLDLGAGTGRASAQLKRRYPRARVIALDLSLGMLTEARRHQRLWRRFARVCADAQRLPLAAASVNLVVSNLMLQWCQPLDAAFAEVRRVLRPEGFFAFSTFGPATLQELRAAWRAADELNHVNHFIDVHDVGAALVRAGLSEPVLDVDRYEATYPDALALMRELKSIGAHNVTAGRPRTLRGRERLRRMQRAYEAVRRDGLLPATFEVHLRRGLGCPGTPRRTAHRRRGAHRARLDRTRAAVSGPRAVRDGHRYRRRQDPDRLRAGADSGGLGAAGRGHEAGRLRCRAHAPGPAQRRRARPGRLRQCTAGV